MSKKNLICAVFLFSGMCALFYQVVWVRMLSLVLGNTHHAVATVLTIFMLGLAVGSYVAGKCLKKIKNFAFAYGFIEILLGLYALIFPFVLKLIESVYWGVFPLIYDYYFFDIFVKFMFSFVALIVPTVLMGATLPIFIQYVEAENRNLANKVGLLYGINTSGASLGAFVSSFWIIPYYGLRIATIIAAVVNILVGVLCIVFLESRNGVSVNANDSKKVKNGRGESLVDALSVSLLLVVLFVTGAAGMLLENGWSHALVLVFGTSVYAFATMLTTYLAGLAMGCVVASRFLPHIRTVKILSILLLINGIAVIVTTPIIGYLPGWFVSVFGDIQTKWSVVIYKEFLACAALMIIPTFLNGAIFPICLHFIVLNNERSMVMTGSNTAFVYVWNTTGSIFGALLAGFVLIPVFGSEFCLLFAGVVIFYTGIFLYISNFNKRAKYISAISAVLFSLSVLFCGSTWDAAIMNSGVYVYSKSFEDAGALRKQMKNFDLLYYKEGAVSVAVLEGAKGHRFLRVNGKTDGSSEGDNVTQMLLGYLPSLYASNMDAALVVGFGTGITSGSVLDLPVKSLETIEISPEVLGAAPYFEALNSRVFSDSRSVILELDGRTWLSSIPKKYDMIISEPSNPWQTGNANLFTVEFFYRASMRLNQGGVLCQWLPYYNMDSSHFRLIIKSLKSVFPYVNLWMSGTDTFLISSMEPLNIQIERVNALFENAESRKKLQDMSIYDKSTLLGFYYLDSEALDVMVSNTSSLNTDNFPIVEFHSPKYLLGPNRPDVFFDILDLSYESTLPLDIYSDDNFSRITSRRKFYDQWRIPQHITDQMIQRALFQ